MKKSSIESAEASIAEQAANENSNEQQEIEEAAKLLDEIESFKELDDPELIDEAANLNTTVYDLLQQNYNAAFNRIALPDHLR